MTAGFIDTNLVYSRLLEILVAASGVSSQAAAALHGTDLLR